MNSGLVRTTTAGVTAAANSEDEAVAVVGTLIHIHLDGGEPCIEGNEAVVLIVLHRVAWQAVYAAVLTRGGEEDVVFEVELDCIRIRPEDRDALALPDPDAIPTRVDNAGEALTKLWS